MRRRLLAVCVNLLRPQKRLKNFLQRANPAKGFQENFLGAVGGIGSIAEHAENEVIDRSMVVRDKPVEGRLRAGLQLMDEIGFIAAPTKGTSPIGHCRPFRLDICQASFSDARKASHPATVHYNALAFRTLDPGTTCEGHQDRAVTNVRSLDLDTEESDRVS